MPPDTLRAIRDYWLPELIRISRDAKRTEEQTVPVEVRCAKDLVGTGMPVVDGLLMLRDVFASENLGEAAKAVFWPSSCFELFSSRPRGSKGV